jgi:hypothetical protein
MLKYTLFALLITWFCLPCQAQTFSFYELDGSESVDIPFDYTNNFILIKIKLNQKIPLNFILDTGAEHTILTKKEIGQLLGLQSVRPFTLIGSDMKQQLIAHLVLGVHLQIADRLKLDNQSILMLEEDYFRFEEFTGAEVHGILGSNVFRNFVVKINYDKHIITLLDPAKFRPPRGSRVHELPISIEKNKPYCFATLQLNPDKPAIPVKLLMDTGASLSLLLHTGTHPDIKMPAQVIRGNIGKGLGGFLEGFLGRVSKLNLAGFQIPDMLTNFQDISPDLDTTYLNGRQGILGNLTLDRFIVYIDYPHDKAYLHASKKLKTKFKFDRSGLVIIASGTRLSQFTIIDVLENSPASDAGILPDDQILRVNLLPYWSYTLMDLSHKFKGQPGKKIRLKLLRNGQIIKRELRLRELI